MLTPEQWEQAEQLFDQSLSLSSEKRFAYLNAICKDESLISFVLQLLQRHDNNPDFLEAPSVDFKDFLKILAKQSTKPVLAGCMVGPYRVIDRLGEGGMGTVYLAERADGQYVKRVCIKTLRDSSEGGFLVSKFLDERQILAELDHPNIARLLDGGTTEEGLPYLVMEYVQGEPIDHYCAQRRLCVRERLELFLQICEAVSYAHQRRVIHRDLKPGNIFVTSEAQVKLLDFGIARLMEPNAQKTAPGYRMFTPNYAAPEQIEGRDISPLCDVYALGVLLYELLSGKRPPAASAEHAPSIDPPSKVLERLWIEAAGLSGGVDRLRRQVQGELDAVVLKALAYQSNHRYETVGALAADLKRYLAGEAVEAFSVSRWYRWSKFIKCNKERFGFALGTVALVATLGWNQFNAVSRPTLGRTIAVLPFENSGGNDSEKYLSNGIAEDLTTQLGKISDLTVISNRAAMQFKDSSKSLQDIAHALGVTSIVTGRIRKEGQNLRVSIQLVDPKSGVQMWAESYECPMSSVFAIQADITRQVSQTLQVKLTPDEKRRSQTVRKTNPMAYAYVLKGHKFYWRDTSRDDDLAIALFKHAIAIDASYAPAHSGLALAYSDKATFHSKRIGLINDARHEALKAIELDAELPEAHRALGRIYALQGDNPLALEQFQKAVSLNPNYAEALVNIGAVSIALGRLDEAEKRVKQALVIDPSYVYSYTLLGYIYSVVGVDQLAESWFNKALELDPDDTVVLVNRCDYYRRRKDIGRLKATAKRVLQLDPNSAIAFIFLGQAEQYQGHWLQAHEYYLKAQQILGGTSGMLFNCYLPIVLGYTALRLGRTQEAAALLSRSERLARREKGNVNYVPSFFKAQLAAVQGNVLETNRWLQTAIEAGFADYRWILNDPMFERVKINPEFLQIIAGLKAKLEPMRIRVEKEATQKP